jgi:polysaccharide export outer membrane protein
MTRASDVLPWSGKWFACLAVVIIGGCTAAELPAAPQISTPVAGSIADLPPYRIQTGDVLGIRFFVNPELNDDVTVRPDGMISTSLVQDVPAYGHTPMEVTEELRQDYAKDLRKPLVSVIVKEFAPNRVYVGGEVNNPGEFITVGPNLTVLQAIARAGNVKLSAGRDKVIIIRRGKGDVPEALAVDYEGAISGKHPEADVRLAQFDVVYVPRSNIYEVYVFFNQYVQQFVPLNWGFSYNVNPLVK